MLWISTQSAPLWLCGCGRHCRRPVVDGPMMRRLFLSAAGEVQTVMSLQSMQPVKVVMNPQMLVTGQIALVFGSITFTANAQFNDNQRYKEIH